VARNWNHFFVVGLTSTAMPVSLVNCSTLLGRNHFGSATAAFCLGRGRHQRQHQVARAIRVNAWFMGESLSWNVAVGRWRRTQPGWGLPNTGAKYLRRIEQSGISQVCEETVTLMQAEWSSGSHLRSVHSSRRIWQRPVWRPQGERSS
jgi:hypothetical protein